jgi:RNA polymerase sigma-70 factor (ECF subfamily)
MTSDHELLRSAPDRAGAVGELYERHARAVFGYLARRVGYAAAEDLLADVFVAALGARHRVWAHRSGSALPWLYGIAGNVVRSHLRAAVRRQIATGRHSDIGADPPSRTAATVDWDAVDARLDAAATGASLRVALGALSDAERELLLLVAWEQLTPAEAGAALGLTPVTARSRLHRARRRARAALDEATSPDLSDTASGHSDTATDHSYPAETSLAAPAIHDRRTR